MKIKAVFMNRYNDEEFMFKLTTGLKFVFISLGFTFSVLLFTYLFMKIDLIYFVAHGYPGATEFQDAFYDFIYSAIIDEIPYMVIAILFIFCLGFYLSSIMIRPFKVIGKYCEERLSNKTHYYSPDYISDLKLLTSFSVFFFSHIDEAKTRGKLEKVEVPQDYTRIHKPVFEKNFFFNYIFIIVIFALLASVGIFVVNNILREQIFQLTQKFLSSNTIAGSKGIRYFLEEQFSVADIAVYFFLSMHILMYCLLGVHLYGKISGPAFAVFATMRSFLRGNYHNRVHLIGHYYLRDDCRKINKYLDHIQKNLT
ncbi:MAG: hypothetical protein H7281_15775 [Bacteriovorax sp.]|nr:hypothetical protein [Bacteriovorax sp.]